MDFNKNLTFFIKESKCKKDVMQLKVDLQFQESLQESPT